MFVEALSEQEYDQRKARWRREHRWAEPSPTTYATLTGDIDDRAINQLIRAVNQDPAAPIDLRISSAGGDPVAALRAYHFLRGHCAPVAIDVPEKCSSAAILILLAGDRRSAAASARFALHHAEFAIARVGRQTASLMRNHAEALAEVDENMVWYLATRSRCYQDWEVRRDMQNEVVLDGREAFYRGLLTEDPR